MVRGFRLNGNKMAHIQLSALIVLVEGIWMTVFLVFILSFKEIDETIICLNHRGSSVLKP